MADKTVKCHNRQICTLKTEYQKTIKYQRHPRSIVMQVMMAEQMSLELK